MPIRQPETANATIPTVCNFAAHAVAQRRGSLKAKICFSPSFKAHTILFFPIFYTYPMTNVPFIEFENVAFAYGERPILQNVSFAVAQGRFAAIMGGSGSGKTTLMRLITGQLRPSAGKVLLNGRDLGAFSAHELNEHRRRMGVLFQQGALFTDLNVFDNLAFPMRELTRLPENTISPCAKKIIWSTKFSECPTSCVTIMLVERSDLVT